MACFLNIPTYHSADRFTSGRDIPRMIDDIEPIPLPDWALDDVLPEPRIPKLGEDGEFDVREYAFERARDLARIYTPQSSNIQAYTYDMPSAQLHIWFQSKTAANPGPPQHYVYFNVDQDAYQRLQDAVSKGQFVSQNIKNAYTYLNLTDSGE